MYLTKNEQGFINTINKISLVRQDVFYSPYQSSFTFVDKWVRKSIYTGKRRAAPCGNTARPLLVVIYISLFSSCRMKYVRSNFRIRGQRAPFPWKSSLIHSSPPFLLVSASMRIQDHVKLKDRRKEGAPDQLPASTFLPLNGAVGQFPWLS